MGRSAPVGALCGRAGRGTAGGQPERSCPRVGPAVCGSPPLLPALPGKGRSWEWGFQGLGWAMAPLLSPLKRQVRGAEGILGGEKTVLRGEASVEVCAVNTGPG